ncbi:tRNA pseudouridine(55) synthase TruB [Candidatus Peregrinibacteria bacterium]|nr:tRNA pseudouridine(55) synthase TruB [Candidatus Peregrinibacteria bacterium]
MSNKIQSPKSQILLIDKPSGITSFDVIRQLRKKLGIRKMGHAGTLDPLATGLLIIAVGAATKEISKYMGLPKEYEVLIEFGKTSTTYDADGEISQGILKDVSRAEFKNVLKNFVGEIMQMPPIFSAKKIKGVRAYDLARQGKEVKLEPRKVQIDKIEIIEWSWPFVRLRINCGKGTYIRSIAHDIGEKLGCGGYVCELRRTAIGEFRVENAQRI